MASNLLKFPTQSITTPNPSIPKPPFTIKTLSSLSIPLHHHHHYLFFTPQNLTLKAPKILALSQQTPPTTKEEAINQAKTCLSTTLEKPLNNPRLAGKLKKTKQLRVRVEIPVIDDSAHSLTQLSHQVFDEMPIRRKGSKIIKTLLLWPNSALKEMGINVFANSSYPFEHMDLSSVSTDFDSRLLGSVDVVVFVAPEGALLESMKVVCDALYPSPVVLFNPKWAFEEESEFGEMGGFVGSFEVVYAFMGLEVRGVLSKRRGVVFKCVRDGVVSGERWEVMVEEEEKFKVVSRFTKRPSIGEVENVLYNVMAVNSPFTKSAKFIRDLVSNVTGKK
ncbi:hypothetical protein Syun_010235 [Stephania yunnanensis]|uniref:DUF1995 domain-containing protein n=1 Tax=Stephania yunnanensis TaxID=152371 RepID=A0AAP0KG23_9MAGN